MSKARMMIVSALLLTVLGMNVHAQKQPPTPGDAREAVFRKRPAEANAFRVTLVHADPESPVRADDLLRGAAFVTTDVMPGAFTSPTELHPGGDRLTVADGKGGGFIMALAAREDDRTVVEWHAELDDTKRQRIVDALTKTIAQRGQVAPEERGAQVEKLRKERESIRAKQSMLAALVRGQTEARKDGLAARLARLDAERERLEIDLTAARAREQALKRQMEIYRKEADQRAHNDPIQDQLIRVLALRQEELKRIKQLADAGQGSMQEVRQAEAQVAVADGELLVRREQVMRGGDDKGDLLGRLANELAMLSIDEAEKEARLQFIQDRLPQLNPKALDEKALDYIAQQYPALLTEPGELPPLYFELDKRQAELLKKELALLVSEVRVEAEPTSAPAP